MSVKINKNGKEYDLGFIPEHYPADRVYLDGDVTKTVQDAIERGYVISEKDGTKTWSQVFNTLWANADKTKMTDNAYINIDGDIYRVFYKSSSQAMFSYTHIFNSLPAIKKIVIKSSGSTYDEYSNNTFTNNTNSTATKDAYLYY